MAAPVWVLSVDLQTKTATFQSGMADAAKAARGSFTDIKSGAGEMGRETNYSMMEARHGVMLLGEEFGVHLPRALTSFITSIGPIGAAMEAAFPFLAIAVGATLLIEHLAKMHEAGEKLTEDQRAFGLAATNAFNALDDKLLQAQIRADELNGNHLGALHKQLELIDHASMNDLVHAFDEVSKSADAVFKDLNKSWYQFGSGSASAKHALADFQAQYDSLLSQHKDKDASDLLSGTLKSAERILDLQKQAKSSGAKIDGSGGTEVEAAMQFEQSRAELKKAGIGYDEDGLKIQQAVVQALRDQEGMQARIAELKKTDKANDNTAEAQREQAEQAAIYKEQQAGLARRAEIEDRYFKEQKTRRESAAKAAESELRKDDESLLKAMQAGAKGALEIDQAAQAETLGTYILSLNQQKDALDSRHKLGLMSEREYAEEMTKIYREEFEAQKAYTETQISRTSDPDKKLQLQKQLTEETMKYSAALAKVNEAAQSYESSWSQYFTKMDAATQDLGRSIRVNLQGSIDTAVTGFSSGFAKMVVEGKSMAGSMQQVAAQMAEHFIESEIRQLAMHEMATLGKITNNQAAAASDKATSLESQLAAAKAAAAKAFEAGWHFPFPANIVMAPAMGGAAFAAALAFEGGGIVPGIGNRDTVPAMLTPGEAVLPKNMTEMLTHAASSGSTGGGDVHLHHSPTYHVQTIDGDGIRDVLSKHSDEFEKHARSVIRKMNG